jgi:hypothetical protein
VPCSSPPRAARTVPRRRDGFRHARRVSREF